MDRQRIITLTGVPGLLCILFATGCASPRHALISGADHAIVSTASIPASSHAPRPLPATVREHLDAAWEELMVAQTPPDRRRAAERFAMLAGIALDKTPDLDSDAGYWLAQRRIAARKLFHEAHVEITLDKSRSAAGSAPRYSQAIESWRNAAEAGRQAQVELIWLQAERDRLADIVAGCDRCIAGEKQEWNVASRDIRRLFQEQQLTYIDRRAQADCSDAGDILDQQKRKAFNWRILGYPRDATDSLYGACQLAARVSSSSSVTIPVRTRAALLCSEIRDRFSNRELRALAVLPALSAYEMEAACPVWTESDVRDLADQARAEHLAAPASSDNPAQPIALVPPNPIVEPADGDN